MAARLDASPTWYPKEERFAAVCFIGRKSSTGDLESFAWIALALRTFPGVSIGIPWLEHTICSDMLREQGFQPREFGVMCQFAGVHGKKGVG